MARDDDADDGYADQAGHARDGVVDRRGDTGVGLVRVGQHGGASGATVSESPRAKTSIAGNTSVRYDGVQPSAEQQQDTRARATNGPAP